MADTVEAPVEAPKAPVAEAPVPPAEPVTPPGTVQLTVEEHSRLQAEARTAKKRAAKLEEEKTSREAADAAEAARAAGEFDTALHIEREEAKRLREQLAARDVTDAVRDAILSQGFTGSRASGLQRLVNAKAIEVIDGVPDPDGVTAAVAATIEQYPDLFQTSAPASPAPEEEGAPMRRTPGPAAPPNANLDGAPPDYVSPQEYVKTPHKVRITPEFRERVRKSRPHWPVKIPATSFTVDQ
jgi:hypothetical protein